MMIKFNKRIVFIFSLIFVFTAFSDLGAQNTRCYNVLLYLSDDGAKVLDNRLVEDCDINFEEVDRADDYYYILEGMDEAVIEKNSIAILSDEKSVVLKDSGLFNLAVPFNNKSRKLTVYDKNNNNMEVISIDLTVYNNCGNSICDKNENSGSCAVDCPTGGNDGFCDNFRDNICDIDCLGIKENRDFDCLDIEKIKNKEEVEKFMESLIAIRRENLKKNEETVKPKLQQIKNEDKNFKIIIFSLVGLSLILLIMLFYNYNKKRRNKDII